MRWWKNWKFTQTHLTSKKKEKENKRELIQTAESDNVVLNKIQVENYTVEN